MSLDEGFDDGQAQAQAPLFLGIRLKWLEHFVKTLFRIPAPLSLTQHSTTFSAEFSRAPIVTSPRGVYRMALAIKF